MASVLLLAPRERDISPGAGVDITIGTGCPVETGVQSKMLGRKPYLERVSFVS